MNKDINNSANLARETKFREQFQEEEEVSILDYLMIIASNLRFIVITTLLFVIFGLFIAIFSKPEYTATARVIRETPSSPGMSSSIAALRGFGLNLGGGATGLNPETIPEILKSKDVYLNVAMGQYHFKDIDSTMSFIDYLEWKSNSSGILGTIKKYTIGLPGTIVRSLKKNLKLEGNNQENPDLLLLTKSEKDAIEIIENMLSVDIARESGIMTITGIAGEPILAANIVKNTIEQLTFKVRTIYTQKSRDNVNFIRDRFNETAIDLEKAEEELAKFLDSNKNPKEAKLEVEIERLRRQVNFKSQLYQEFQSQLTQAEIELQRIDPVLTVIEQPSPPLEKSGPKRKLTVILALFLGAGFSIGFVFMKEYLANLNKEEESRDKLKVIEDNLKKMKQSFFQIFSKKTEK